MLDGCVGLMQNRRTMLPDFKERIRRPGWLSTLRPRLLWSAAMCLLSMACNTDSVAQAYPNKPLRFVLGFSPGGASDIVARIVGA